MPSFEGNLLTQPHEICSQETRHCRLSCGGNLGLCNVRKVSFDPWVVTIERLGRGVGAAARQRI